MKFVLVTIDRGLIDEVTFYGEQLMTLHALCEFVKAMQPEHHDAAVFGPDGMIANAKAFLDENDQFIEQSVENLAIVEIPDESIYIIGNPCHSLGFMVTSPDDPLGYKDPAEAVSDLGQMRKDHGNHLKIYRILPVDDPIASRPRLEKHNADCEVEDFEYSLVEEYVR